MNNNLYLQSKNIFEDNQIVGLLKYKNYYIISSKNFIKMLNKYTLEVVDSKEVNNFKIGSMLIKDDKLILGTQRCLNIYEILNNFNRIDCIELSAYKYLVKSIVNYNINNKDVLILSFKNFIYTFDYIKKSIIKKYDFYNFTEHFIIYENILIFSINSKKSIILADLENDLKILKTIKLSYEIEAILLYNNHLVVLNKEGFINFYNINNDFNKSNFTLNLDIYNILIIENINLINGSMDGNIYIYSLDIFKNIEKEKFENILEYNNNIDNENNKMNLLEEKIEKNIKLIENLKEKLKDIDNKYFNLNEENNNHKNKILDLEDKNNLLNIEVNRLNSLLENSNNNLINIIDKQLNDNLQKNTYISSNFFNNKLNIWDKENLSKLKEIELKFNKKINSFKPIIDEKNNNILVELYKNNNKLEDKFRIENENIKISNSLINTKIEQFDNEIKKIKKSYYKIKYNFKNNLNEKENYINNSNDISLSWAEKDNITLAYN